MIEFVKGNSDKAYSANIILSTITFLISTFVYGIYIHVVVFGFTLDGMILAGFLAGIPGTILNLLINLPIICAIIYFETKKLINQKFAGKFIISLIILCMLTWPYVLSILGYIKYKYIYYNQDIICSFDNYYTLINPTCAKFGIDVGLLIFVGYVCSAIICAIIWSIHYVIKERCCHNNNVVSASKIPYNKI